MPSNALVLRKDLSLPCFDCHQKQGVGGRGADEQISPELDMKETIKQYLLTMPENPEGRQALMELGNASGFLETTDADYAELYKMLNELHIRPQVFLISE
jgi:hypothetical protein